MAVALSANFADLIAPGLHKIIFEAWSEYPLVFEQIFNVDSSDQAYETDSAVSGVGMLATVAEGADVSYDQVYQGFDKQYTHSQYANGFRVSKMLQMNDLYGPMKRMSEALGRAGRATVEYYAASVFNNGFSTTYAGPDAVALFATTHPLLGGGTEQNKLTTNADISVTSLRTAINDFEDFVDLRGDLKNQIKPRVLLVPNELKWEARELLGSAQKPYTGDNELNAFQDEGLTYTVWTYLTDADAWFLLADKGEHYLMWWWREQWNTTDEVDFDSRDIKIAGWTQFSYGWSDFRGVYGSPGA